MITPIRPEELHNLSAYLDGQLSPAEIRQLEERLHAQANLRSALEELRQTRALLRSMPRRKVPHNFTLTPAMAGRRKSPWVGWLRFSSAFASAAAVLLLFFNQLAGLGGSFAPAAAAPVPMAAEKQMTAATSSADASQPSEIIVWGGPPAAGGKGGGGGEAPGAASIMGVGGGPAAVENTAPQPMPTLAPPDQIGLLTPTPTVPAAVPPLEPTPFPTATAAVPTFEPTFTQVPTIQPTPQPTLLIDGASPVLGLPAEGKRGLDVSPTQAAVEPASVRSVPDLIWPLIAAGFLALIAIGTGLTAFWISRRSK